MKQQWKRPLRNGIAGLAPALPSRRKEDPEDEESMKNRGGSDRTVG
jgi:hypothetical protein